jgi:CubicO group peptidase (beta-lactamase class C family)
MRRFWIAGLALCAATTAWAADLPKGVSSILFWTPRQQETGYRAVEEFFPVRTIKRGTTVRPLPDAARPADIRTTFQGKPFDSDAFIKANHLSGLLVIKDGQVVVEKYALGRKPEDRWVSFSVTKSITALLVGAAIEDGAIKSLDSNVVDYIPHLKGSAYDGVTVRQLLTMTSGVKWSENYSDPNSDVAKFALGKPGPDGESGIVAYMAKLPREAKPGTKFSYKTGESDLVGILIEHATHKHLADYLSQKIWAPFGMERDANWMLDLSGTEIGGCCVSMTLRDYGRFGLFVMGGAVAGGKPVVPADYLAAATKRQVQSDFDRLGYGYQWWIHDDGSYEAVGIFGQSIYVNPKEKLVIVTNSAWPEADAEKYYVVTDAYQKAVIKALHTP